MSLRGRVEVRRYGPPSASVPDRLPVLRIIVVDDQWMIREGLASLAGLEDDIEVVAIGADGNEAVALVGQHRPDVVLMDIRMPGLDGIEATLAIHERHPDVKVLMLTTFEDQDLIERSLAAGAAGYLTKDIAAQDLARSIRSAASGVVQLTPKVAQKLLGSADRARSTPTPEPSASTVLDELSARERDVLRLVAQGMSNKQIGAELHLSTGTVKNYVSSILRRLGTTDRTQAAVLAARHGLL